MLYLFLLIHYFLFPFHVADEQPTFKGGANALNSFLANTLVYPEYSRQNCISGNIQVSFQLQPDGTLTNVKIQKGLGIDLDEEALRIVKMTTGKWNIPQNYDKDISLVLPINFKLDEQRCSRTDARSIETAIQVYKARESMVQAVTHYYSTKFEGRADTSKEPEIIALKNDLGLDEEFADGLVRQGNRKLKQGDNAGACQDWLFVRNIGSTKANKLLAQNCN